MKRILILLATIVTSAVLQAQQDVVRFGITGSATLNMHSGTLTTADGLLECGTFQDATTLGWTAGNAIWYPITDKLVFDGRVQYWKADGLFTAANEVQPNVALPDGSLVRMQSEYELQTTLDYVNVDLLGLWYFTPELFVGLGPQIGVNTRAAFSQSEKILAPSYLEFTQGGQERTFLASDFAKNGTQAGIRFAASALVGYDIRVHPNIVVTPEVGYAYAFTNVLNSSNWSVNAARAGVTVSWAIVPPKEPEPKPAEPEIVPVIATPEVKPLRTMVLNVASTMADGTKLSGADIHINEVRNSDVVPLLPFVFFDVNSAVIPGRYHAFTSTSFNEGQIQDSVLGVYHELLNIVGSRLRMYPEATLTIAGYREPTDGENSASLAASRADVVKEYLVRNWGIAGQRISTTAGISPSVISSRTNDDGRTENRRAELASNDARILAPVNLSRTTRSVEPRSIAINPEYATPNDVSGSSIEIMVGSTPVAPRLTANGSGGALWNVNVESIAQTLGTRNTSIGSITATTTYTDGEKTQKTAPLSVRRHVKSSRFSNEIVNDSVVERFRLIFFDFDKPTVSEFNRSMIDLVRSRIRTTSAIRVTGLTDRMGSVAHNTELSVRRAEAIDSAIRQRIVPERTSSVGAGPMLIYNNDLPEGRWYNRTVLIEVATPVEEQ